MSDRTPDVEARLRAIEDALARIRSRLTELENDRAAATPRDERETSSDLPLTTPLPRPQLISLAGGMSLIGRTLVVLGGAFLLRALTDNGALPTTSGVALGFTYAAMWMMAADRAGAERPHSAVFHGLAAVLIGLPIVWEATMQFNMFSPTGSAVTLVLAAGFGLAVAWHRHLTALAIAVTSGVLVTALALTVATGQFVPFTLFALIFGVTLAWLAEPMGWPWLRWPTAIVANLLMLGVLMRAFAPEPVEPPAVALTVMGLFVAAYLVTAAWHTRAGGHPAGPFEVAQTGAVVVIGVGGGLLLAAQTNPELSMGLGAVVILIGVAAYSAGFLISESEPKLRTNINFYATTGLVLMLFSGPALLADTALDLWFVGLAVVCTFVGTRLHGPILMLHAAVYVLAGAISSDLPGLAARMWLTPLAEWPSIGATVWAVMAAGAFGTFGPRLVAQRATGAVKTKVARAVMVSVLVTGAGTWLVGFIGAAVGDGPLAAGPLASLRTIVLSVAAIAAAWLGRFPRARTLAWLAMPILALGAIKLVTQDFWYSEPSTLFVALAIYGVALIVTPRLARRRD